MSKRNHLSVSPESNCSDNNQEETQNSSVQHNFCHTESQDTIINSNQPTKKKRHTNKNQRISWVWEHFTTESTGEKFERLGELVDDAFIVCKHCDWRILDSKRKQSTSNMKRHLINKHKLSQNAQALPLELSNEEILQKDIVYMIVTQNLPFTFIESDGFKKILKHIPYQKSGFSATTLTRLIQNESSSAIAELGNLLNETCESISLSLDIWTSPTNDAYLGIIGYWIGTNFECFERLLDFVLITGLHTGENLAQNIVMPTLNMFGLASKVLTITLDNASNNERLVSALKESIDSLFDNGIIAKKKFLGQGSFIRCIAHVLNLIAKAILHNLKSGQVNDVYEIFDNMNSSKSVGSLNAIMKIRALALYIENSPQRKEKWLKLVPKEVPKKFIQYDVETRWNSTYHMIEDAFIFQSEIANYVIENNLHEFSLSPNDWILLTNIKIILEKFDRMTMFLSSHSPQMINSLGIYYTLHDLLCDIIERKNRFKGITDDVVDAVKSAFDKYKKYYDLMDVNDTYYIAATLDPRTKSIWLQKHLDEESYKIILRDVQIKIKNEYDCNIENERDDPTSDSNSDNDFTRIMLKSMTPETKTCDVESYYISPVINTHVKTNDFNWILVWWRENQTAYPRMAKVARDYLAIPASSVSIERLFNVGRDVIGIRRHSMNSNTFRMLLLLQDHYRYVSHEKTTP